MAGRVRGSCNKEQQIKSCLEQALQEARGIVLEVVRQGANFIVKLKTAGEQIPVPVAVVQLISETIRELVKKLELKLSKHKSDGFSITYRLASG